MPRFILTIFIFVIIISVSTASLLFVINSTSELEIKIDKIIDLINVNNIDSAIIYSELFLKNWNKTESFIITLVRHDSIDEITLRANKMLAFGKSNDKSNFLAEAYALKMLISHIRENEIPLLHNFL